MRPMALLSDAVVDELENEYAGETSGHDAHDEEDVPHTAMPLNERAMHGWMGVRGGHEELAPSVHRA